jgi:signal recognition particle receptor subunit beta
VTALYVFVTGPQGSGKSEFLRALGDPADWWEDEQQGLEFRHLFIDETLDVYLFCAADSARFDCLMEVSQRDLLGYVVLVDSTSPDSWNEARLMIANCRGYARLPMVIAANKQDLPGACTAEQVGGWIGMDTMMRVCPCSATNPSSARNVFLQLLYSVQHEIDRLDMLIAEIEQMMAENAGNQE